MTEKEKAVALLEEQRGRLEMERLKLCGMLNTVDKALGFCCYHIREFEHSPNESRTNQLVSFTKEIAREGWLDGASEETKLSKRRQT